MADNFMKITKINTKEKKIIFTGFNFSGTGGMETVYNRVLEYYSNKEEVDVSFTAFTSIKSRKWLNAQVKIEEFLTREPNQLKKNKQIRVRKIISVFNYFRRIEADIVILPIPTILTLVHFARILNRNKFRIVYWPHFDINSTEFSKKANYKRVQKYSDQILSISDSITKAYIEKGISEEKIRTIYNPIPKQERTIHTDSHTTRFIYVGRLEFGNQTQKNNKEMFDALKKMKDENWVLDVYGSGLGNYAEQEKQYVKKIGISNKVTFHGWCAKPFDQIETASALILTSTFEGLPMAPLEALSFGIPVVISDINGPTDYVSEKNGFKYPLHNLDALHKILLAIVMHKKSFNSNDVKSSISKFYEEDYFVNLNSALLD